MRNLILAVVVLMPTIAYGDYIEESLAKAAAKVGVPQQLLKAICNAESNLNAKAYVHADGGNNNHAFGMCQVLLKTAEQYGLSNHKCDDNFSYKPEDRVHANCRLFGPYTNALYAAKYLKYQLDRYGGSWVNAIAAYNSGTVRLCKTGWVKNARGVILYKCEKGGLLNQKYVDRVIKTLFSEQAYVEYREFSPIQKREEEQEGSTRRETTLIDLEYNRPDNKSISD